jgi:hypothetical protein
MRTIIAGSRSITNYLAVKAAIEESGFKITEVVSGGAHGVDRLGEQWARENNIHIRRFLPDWTSMGNRLESSENHLMVGYAEALIAVHDGSSKGTGHMIRIAKEKGLLIYTKLTY